MGIIETLDTVADKISNAINTINEFLSGIYNIINQLINILPNNLKSIFIVGMVIIPVLIIYNFIWGGK